MTDCSGPKIKQHCIVEVYVYFICETGSLGILSFQSRLLYQRKLSRDIEKETPGGTRDHHVPVEDP